MRIKREVLENAREDLEVAEELYGLGRYRHSCFLAQQAVEKIP